MMSFILSNITNLSTTLTNDTTLTDVKDVAQDRIIGTKRAIEYGILSVICIIGIIGNCVAFLMLWRSLIGHYSYSVYLLALAIFDTANLITELVLKTDKVLWTVTGESFLSSHTDITCKISEFISHSNILMSSWLIAAFSTDRYVAVCCPFFKFRFCTIPTARIITVALTLTALVSQAYRIVLVTCVPSDPSPGKIYQFPCMPEKDTKDRFFFVHFFVYSFGLRFLLPFIVLALSNAFVIRDIHYRWRRKDKNKQQPSESKMVKHSKATIQARLAQTTLFLVCAYFICTMLPSSTIEIIWYIARSNANFDVYLKLVPLVSPFDILRITNYSVNFFIYFVSFRSFRRELRRCRYIVMERLGHGRYDSESST